MNKSVSQSLFRERKDLSVREAPEPINMKALQLPDKCINELVSVAGKASDVNFELSETNTLPECTQFAVQIRSELFENSGCVLIDRFPVEKYNTEINRRVAGIFANLISPLMPQDTKGTRLYDVLDAGGAQESTTRRSKTNHAQPFHTDGPWLTSPPNVVGLFCIQPADTGGYSQVSGLLSALSEAGKAAGAIDQCYEKLHWNKMGQHGKEESRYSMLPIVESLDGAVLIRHYSDYVRTGYDLAGDAVPDNVEQLLHTLDLSLITNACRPFRLESGQFQFINNYKVAHARAGFTDSNSQSGRHLVRLWCARHSQYTRQFEL